jgi:hypothetical protein
MKKAFVVVVVYFLSALNLAAQWTPSSPPPGATISYNGPVAVGTTTTSTAYTLNVVGTSRLGGNVFLGISPSVLYLWPDASGSYLYGTGIGIDVVAQGGTIRLTNGITAVEGWPGSAAGTSALAVRGSNSTSANFAASFTNSGGTSLMAIRNDGRVGIGTSSPAYPLDVAGNSRLGGNVFLGTGGPSSLYLWLDASGPHLAPNQSANGTWNGIDIFAQGGTIHLFNGDTSIDGYGTTTSALVVKGSTSGSANSAASFTNSTGASLLFVRNDGRVGIGTTSPTATLEVNGTIKATSVIGAVYQDVAEWVPATEEMQAGTVVVVSDADNTVSPSARAYDTRVAGVVSAQPGLLLGVEALSKAKIATTGRVKVRVDARKHPIATGDLLVTSDTTGTAMRSEPLDLAGVKIHRPGTLIGKALQPLASGQGEILVLLSLQ